MTPRPTALGAGCSIPTGGLPLSDLFDFIPNWSDTELNLYNDAFATSDSYNDPVAQAMYHEGYFNMDISSDDRIAIRQSLDSYMMDEYGIDFSEVFDWEAWREAYGEAA